MSDDDDRLPIAIAATGYVRLRLVPENATPERTVVAVHGYGQSPTTWLDYVCSIVPPGTAVVAPEGPSAFYRRPRGPGGASKGGIGHGWIADPRREDAEQRNDDLLAKAIDLAVERVRAPADDVVLIGYSQGVGVATHFAVSQPTRVRALVGLAGGVPPTWRDRLSALAGMPVLWVTGTDDHAYSSDYNETLVRHWQSSGVPLTHCLLESGHDLLEPAAAPVRGWLSEVPPRGA